MQKRSQKFKVMRIEHFERELCSGFLVVAKLPDNFSLGKIGLKFVTETSAHSSHRSSQEAKKLVTSCSLWGQSHVKNFSEQFGSAEVPP